MVELDHLLDTGEPILGLQTLFSDLDRQTGGFYDGDLVVLATGMVPNSVDTKIPGLNLEHDEMGFAMDARDRVIHVAGVTRRPMDVVSSVRDGTGAALKAARDLSHQTPTERGV